jgi:hypothetical protein
MLNLISNTPTVGLICAGVIVYMLYQALCFNLESDTSFEYTTTLGELKEGQVFSFESNQEVLYEIDTDGWYLLCSDNNFSNKVERWNKDVRVVVQGVLSE